MKSLKKIISMNEASKISGYHRDHLSYLIRKGDIRGKKIGISWFTTEEEIQNYVLKKKVRRHGFGISDFLSMKKTHRIFIAAFIVFFVFITIGTYKSTNIPSSLPKVDTKISETNEVTMIQELKQ